MDDIGVGLLLNLVFWVVSVSALVFLGVWAAVNLFLGVAERMNRVKKTVRTASGLQDPRHPSPEQEGAGDRYRKAS